MRQLKDWLLKCNYPAKVINKGIHNAKIQGPAPPPKCMDKSLIFTSTFVSNFSHDNTIHQINELLTNTKSAKLNEVFDGCQAMIAYKQPMNVERILTRASFNTPSIGPSPNLPNGLVKCGRDICKFCRLYIQECTSFLCSNGETFEIRTHIHCNSINVLYWLKCIWCKDPPIETYTGKTKNEFRIRNNNHVTGCRLGTSSDMFDNHVYECRKKHGASGDIEPFFHVYAFYTVKDEQSLITHEKHLHSKGYDTMNRPR